mgnify:FL=1
MKFTVEQARKFANKTQREMASLMGICRDTYRNIERNPEDATIRQAKDISRITSIPLDQIFFVQ